MANIQRLIYVQFQGNYTRKPVNGLHQALQAASTHATIPSAERVAGGWGNSVRHFDKAAAMDAQALSEWLQHRFHSGRCNLAAPVKAKRVQAIGLPQHLKIWIHPRCETP